MDKRSLLSLLKIASKGTSHKGMDDSIVARQDGVHPVGLSSGEYVIPADVVSMIGDGDTDAGAAALDKMIETIRKKKGKSLAKGKQANPLAQLLGN